MTEITINSLPFYLDNKTVLNMYSITISFRSGFLGWCYYNNILSVLYFMAFYIELILNSNEKRAETVGKWFHPTNKNAEVDTPHRGPLHSRYCGLHPNEAQKVTSLDLV